MRRRSQLTKAFCSLVATLALDQTFRQTTPDTSVLISAPAQTQPTTVTATPPRNLQADNPDAEQQRTQASANGQPKQEDLTGQEQQKLRELQARDREVRAHEQAHLSAAGGHANGGASYTYERGPDQRMYAVGGEVSVDTSKVTNDPVATLRKAQTIRRAALAPANPSSQDRRVAAKAAQMETEARMEISAQRTEMAAEESTDVESRETTPTQSEAASETNKTCPSCGGAHTAGAHDGMTAYGASTAPPTGTQVNEGV